MTAIIQIAETSWANDGAHRVAQDTTKRPKA